ncbi:hypothetical protein Salat_1876100 [Sesamum alatum]|uniref:Uncharacterized protein n=1 Tax=Sesamum alatum TaxID=300844 RepID=A0AAE1Y3A4_9LAMI|nr:hypothetical protein Salat_1876100 [Sesamum alatum]
MGVVGAPILLDVGRKEKMREKTNNKEGRGDKRYENPHPLSQITELIGGYAKTFSPHPLSQITELIGDYARILPAGAITLNRCPLSLKACAHVPSWAANHNWPSRQNAFQNTRLF